MGTEIKTSRFIALLGLVLLFACVKDRNFDLSEPECQETLPANTTYSEVKNRYTDNTFQIQEDLIIEGYVVSSDEAGNFFSVLHFQNNPIRPTEGFQIEIDIRDAHLFYPVGSKIYIKLKGLYLGKSKDVFKLGGTFTSFGNVSVGRLPAAIVDQHIFVSCGAQSILEPAKVSIGELNESLTNTLVQFSNVQVLEEELGETFADLRKETERTLIDCKNNQIILLNSGFSDFQSEDLPRENGTITGVLLREKDNYKLAIRSLDDIDFMRVRCEEELNGFSSKNIFISELADPENNSKARFVELYNGSDTSLLLKGWTQQRYTNSNVAISSVIDLSNFVIESQSTLVISPNAEEFEAVYGFPPDMEVGRNSPADSNGDDNLVLLDPFGDIVDTFGVIGEDGSGTDHDFQNGRAFRNSAVLEGNPVYTLTEWTIYNDTGDSGTIQQPQIAPEDFTPGIRN